MKILEPMDLREKIHEIIDRLPERDLKQLFEQLEKKAGDEFTIKELMEDLEEDRDLLKRLAQ